MTDVFITENFLLETDQAIALYHEAARDLPIIDFHSHLPPAQIAADRRFANLTQIWLAGDHYKWRAMRAAGVPERFITGDASDFEKFARWAETVPQALRNPLYHWTHLELKRPFGIGDRLLSSETAEGIYRQCNELLARPEFSTRGILRQMNVALVCTTDDPADSLDEHAAIAADASMATRVLPTFRPDKALAVEDVEAFRGWVERLGTAAGVDIGGDLDRFLEAIDRRYDHFHRRGCRLSDHGIASFPVADYRESEIRVAFRKLCDGVALDEQEAAGYKSAMLHEFALRNHAHGWTQQFHFGPLRNTNSRGFASLGPDAGFDSIGDGLVAQAMARFFDRLDREDRLAKTIVYNINPALNDLTAAMMGNFQGGGVAGKMQYGSGWWFLDQKKGMEDQLDALSNHGLLSFFVGMVTDSRSFLSFTRHEYFRRILCNKLGGEMARGLLPNDMHLVGKLVRNVCHDNAARYFGFDLE